MDKRIEKSGAVQGESPVQRRFLCFLTARPLSAADGRGLSTTRPRPA